MECQNNDQVKLAYAEALDMFDQKPGLAQCIILDIGYII